MASVAEALSRPEAWLVASEDSRHDQDRERPEEVVERVHRQDVMDDQEQRSERDACRRQELTESAGAELPCDEPGHER